MIDQTIYKIWEGKIFWCFLKWKRKWGNIWFFVSYFTQRKCWKKIKEFIFWKCIYPRYSNWFDIFCQCSFEKKPITIGDEIDGLVFEVEIVGSMKITQDLKKNIKLRSIDDKERSRFDFTYIFLYFSTNICFREGSVCSDKYFLKQCFLFVKILLES